MPSHGRVHHDRSPTAGDILAVEVCSLPRTLRANLVLADLRKGHDLGEGVIYLPPVGI